MSHPWESYQALYVHIPFCVHKCAYCDFASYQIYNDHIMTDYARRLVEDYGVKIDGALHAEVLQRYERLGIAPEHVYCAGDEANDLSMLTMAAEGFAPANCVEAVRACGATIVCDADHGALADIVEILDRRY